MSKKKISSGVIQEVPADLKKTRASDPQALEAWEGITPLAHNEWDTCALSKGALDQMQAQSSRFGARTDQCHSRRTTFRRATRQVEEWPEAIVDTLAPRPAVPIRIRTALFSLCLLAVFFGSRRTGVREARSLNNHSSKKLIC